MNYLAKRATSRSCSIRVPAPKPFVVKPRSVVARLVADSEHVADTSFKLQLTEMQQMFDFWDADHNKVLSEDELERMLMLGVVARSASHSMMTGLQGGAIQMGRYWFTADELKAVLKQYQFDQSGCLDFKGFQELLFDGLLVEGVLREYQALFNALDTDRDGALDFERATRLLQQVMKGRPGGPSLPYNASEVAEAWQSLGKSPSDPEAMVDFDQFMEAFRGMLPELNQVLAYCGAVPALSPISLQQQALEQQGSTTTVVFSGQELEDLMSERQHSPVVLLATMTWSHSDAQVLPAFQALKERLPGAVFLRLYGNASPQSKALFKDRLKARTTPAVFVLRHGKVVASFVGSDLAPVEAFVKEQLGK